MGIRVVMLTGDNERTARAIGAQAGVDDVVAGVLPDGKQNVIEGLKQYGNVAMAYYCVFRHFSNFECRTNRCLNQGFSLKKQ